MAVSRFSTDGTKGTYSFVNGVITLYNPRETLTLQLDNGVLTDGETVYFRSESEAIKRLR